MDTLVTNPVVINSGDRVCVTKIAGDSNIKPGKPHCGTLQTLEEGSALDMIGVIAGDRNLNTSPVQNIFVSFTCILVKTKNSLYLVEKLPEVKN